MGGVRGLGAIIAGDAYSASLVSWGSRGLSSTMTTELAAPMLIRPR